VLNLEVEVSAPPVIEQRVFNVARGAQLCGDPVLVVVVIDVHWNMTHLRRPNKPVALYKPENRQTTHADLRKGKGKRKVQYLLYHHHHRQPWAQCPLVSDAIVTIAAYLASTQVHDSLRKCYG